MNTEVRLGSVVKHGVGGPEAGALNSIYSFLLSEFQEVFYNHISINQIGDDLQEFIMEEKGRNIHVNIRYPVDQNFELKTMEERNLTRLDVIHTALKRIANFNQNLQIKNLELIKEKIIGNNFSFDFNLRSYKNKMDKNLIANIIISPKFDRFDYFILIQENDKVKCKLKIYSGLTLDYYFHSFFSNFKWKSTNEILITGKAKEVEIKVFIDKCEIIFKNLTQYEKPPFFELMKADTTERDRAKASEDWHLSLSPAVNAILKDISEG